MNESLLAKFDSSAPLPSTWNPGLFSSLLGCCLGGLVGMGVVNAVDPYFKFPPLPELGISPSSELVQKHHAAQIEFHSSNLSLNLAIVGLCLGLAIGCLTTRRHRFISSLLAGIVGAMAGALSGYLMGALVAKAIIASANQSLLQSTLYHFACWGAMVTGIVTLLGAIQGGVKRLPDLLVIGLLLGLCVALVYNIVSSALFSGSNLLLVIPASMTERGLWILITSITFGLGLHLLLRSKPSLKTEA